MFEIRRRTRRARSRAGRTVVAEGDKRGRGSDENGRQSISLGFFSSFLLILHPGPVFFKFSKPNYIFFLTPLFFLANPPICLVYSALGMAHRFPYNISLPVHTPLEKFICFGPIDMNLSPVLFVFFSSIFLFYFNVFLLVSYKIVNYKNNLVIKSFNVSFS